MLEAAAEEAAVREMELSDREVTENLGEVQDLQLAEMVVLEWLYLKFQQQIIQEQPLDVLL